MQPTYLNIDLNLIWKISINMSCGKFLLYHVSQSKPSKHKNKCFKLFQNNEKIFLITKSWDLWQYITCSHCSPKKLHLSYKRQYIYDYSKDESVFVDFFFHPKFVVLYD